MGVCVYLYVNAMRREEMINMALDTPLVAAHRGASLYARENSLEAAQMAIDLGADMVEIDVRRTADGVLILHHDANVDGIPLHQLSFEALKGSVPELTTFVELLDVAAGRVKLDVELKEGGYENEVLQEIVTRFPLKDVVVTSSNPDVIAAVTAIAPEVRTGWI